MLRETTFWLGGILTIALGVALAAGLVWVGAGLDYLDAWLACGIAVLFGAFFLHVARDEHRTRLTFLEESDRESSPKSGPGGG